MALNDAVPSVADLEREYGGDTDKLCAEHEHLIEQILEEEEELITGHRRHIDEVVDLVKQEMTLLNDVDKPGSDVEAYVASLDKLLTQKIAMISDMRRQLITFHTHLKTEEAMSKLYQQQQQAQDNQMLAYQQEEGQYDNFANDLAMANNGYGGGQFEDEGVTFEDLMGGQAEYGEEEMLLNDDQHMEEGQQDFEGQHFYQ